MISPKTKLQLPASKVSQNLKSIVHSKISQKHSVFELELIKPQPKSTRRFIGNENETKVKTVSSITITSPVIGLDLPPINLKVDEVYYFRQYLVYYNLLCQECHIPKKKLPSTTICTDDACFLCKDGGDLIECDWKINNNSKSQCRKVYHNYCLSYEPPNDDNEWYCPTHYCYICGTTKLKYSCIYCPVSICSKCPEVMIEKVNTVLFPILYLLLISVFFF